MKLLFNLILIISLISTCYSQSSSSSSSTSSSSSSEECPEHYSGPSCSTFHPYIWLYNAVEPDGIGYVTFYCIFGDTDTTGLSVKIGDQQCNIGWQSGGRIECGVGPLNLYEFYDVEISNSNGVIILHEDFYSPLIYDCGNGNFYMGRCICYTGYEGQLCDTVMTPYITSITSSSVDGGVIQGEGWFGEYPSAQSLSLFIGNKKVRIQTISSTAFIGFAPQGTGSQDVTILDASNQLLFTGSNLYTYDSNKCFNNCYNSGECINGVCVCDYPFVGDFCSHTKDSSCQCTYI